jgi:NhaP-type Na+/H+ or K+/H+ antiporter
MSLGRHAAGDLVDTASMSVAAAAIVSIALGALVGWSLVRTETGAPQRPVAMAVGG